METTSKPGMSRVKMFSGKTKLREPSAKASHPSGWGAFFVFICSVLLLPSGGQVAASESRFPSRLWLVKDPAAPEKKPSYLFGTIHLSDSDVVGLPPHIDRVVAEADSLTMEVMLDGQAYQAFARSSSLQGNTTLSDLVGDAIFNELVALLRPRGLNRYGLERMKPWVVGLMLNYPPPSLEPILDHKLQLRFARAEKPVYQLETVEEQIAIFNQLSMADQIQFLQYSLEQQKQFDGYLHQMKRYYLSDDLDAMQAQATAQIAQVDAEYLNRLYQDLIDMRNKRMTERMQPRLREGGALIAVGALHLTGDQGIVMLLRNIGYRVKPHLPTSH